MTILSYLRFVLAPDADRAAFEEDLKEMMERAVGQPGYKWAELGRDPWNDRKYVVVSEWDEVGQVRAFEHHPEHEAIIRRWESRYEEEFVHRRFVPWVRPS